MKVPNSVLSGLFACLGGLLGKASGYDFSSTFLLAVIIRLTIIACMITVNTISLTHFVKALHESSSLGATTVSSGLNYLLSGILGVIIFGESPSIWLVLGHLCIILGLSLTDFASYNNKNKQKYVRINFKK